MHERSNLCDDAAATETHRFHKYFSKLSHSTSHLSGRSHRVWPKFPGQAIVCINYLLHILSVCVITDAHARPNIRTPSHRHAHARDSHVYLVISILLSEQCICLCRRKVFDELRTAAGAYNAHWALHVLFMHMYAYRMRTRADGRTRNGTVRPPVERSRI